VSLLPLPGRWALGSESLALAESLVKAAQHEGLRTAWLAPEAGFLSNLDMQENLRLVHDWQGRDSAAFEADFAQALQQLDLPRPDWLLQRPAQLRPRQLLQAACLRAVLVAPELLVLHPASLAEAGPALSTQLVAAFAEARLLLLAEPTPDWPAWPQPASAVVVEEHPA
jgi:hypothetical protein